MRTARNALWVLGLAFLVSFLAPSNTNAQCVPGIVTCCFTVSTGFVQLFLNGEDVTWNVQPATAAARSNPALPKTISFLEPRTPVMLAIKGKDTSKKMRPGFQLRCSSTRQSSRWNQVISDYSLQEWVTVQALHATKNVFPSNWYLSNYTGARTKISLLSSDNFQLNTVDCGDPTLIRKLRVPTTRKFFTFATYVNNTCFSSSAPSQVPTTSFPSRSPSAAPTTSKPSRIPSRTPSKSPLTSKPSQTPSKNPSRSPLTSAPSYSPSLTPSTSNPSKIPSRAPTGSPSTSLPSTSPTPRPSIAPSTPNPSGSPTTSSPSGSPVTSAPSSSPTTSTPSSSPTTSLPSSTPSTSNPSNSPSLAPITSAPSHAPSTSAPSKSPTTSAPSGSPTTSSPSLSPTTSAPSGSPTTSAPSTSPTTSVPSKTPTTSVPTTGPSRAPTTSTPSKSPTLPTAQPTMSPGHNKFNIVLINTTVVTSAQQLAFEQAAATWQSIITEDLGSDFLVLFPYKCSFYTFQTGMRSEDMTIAYAITPIDGVGKILGSAGPCAVDDFWRPRLGTMQFDSADVESLIATNRFNDVVLHEMGHVLGIGTLWDYVGLSATSTFSPTVADATRTPTRNPSGIYYTGPEGFIGNSEIGFSGVPLIEDMYSTGTRGGHWKEDYYDTELMTGFAEATGVPMPISNLTIRALRDLGYETDLSQAQSYTPPPQYANGRRRRLRDGDNHGANGVLEDGKVELVGDIMDMPKIQLKTIAKPGREGDFKRQKQRFEQRRAKQQQHVRKLHQDGLV